MERTQLFEIKAVSKRTGLSPFVIRAWENRYNAVTPVRNGNNRRLYCSADIEKLSLLKRATDSGYSIGTIAGMGIEELKEISPEISELSAGPEIRSSTPKDFISDALEKVRAMDSYALNEVLLKASVEFSQPVLFEKFLIPLIAEVGELWKKGDLRIADEHIVTSTIRTFLSNLLNSHKLQHSSASLIVTTPSGQLHELGALISAIIAASEGWNVTYLGPNLPVEEIALSVKKTNSRAVLLSIIYPEDDPNLGNELERLRTLVPKKTAILLSGRGVRGYLDYAEKIEADVLDSPREFQNALELLRKI